MDPERQLIALQVFRMAYCWPIIVGCTAFLAVRLFWLLSGGKPGRLETGASSIVFVGAVIVTATISRNWNNERQYWIAFTAGLFVMAAILLANVIYMVLHENEG